MAVEVDEMLGRNLFKLIELKIAAKILLYTEAKSLKPEFIWAKQKWGAPHPVTNSWENVTGVVTMVHVYTYIRSYTFIHQ